MTLSLTPTYPDRANPDKRKHKVRWFIINPFQQTVRRSSHLHQSCPEYQTHLHPSFHNLSSSFFLSPSSPWLRISLVLPFFQSFHLSHYTTQDISILKTVEPLAFLSRWPALACLPEKDFLMKHTLTRVSQSDVLCVTMINSWQHPGG